MSIFLQNPLGYINLLLVLAFGACLALPEGQTNLLRRVCLIASTAALLLGCISFAAFDQTVAGFQFLVSVPAIPLTNLTFTLGADGLSMIFLLLTLFVFPICFASA